MLRIGNSCVLLECEKRSIEHTTSPCQQAVNARQVKEQLHLCPTLAFADEPQLEGLENNREVQRSGWHAKQQWIGNPSHWMLLNRALTQPMIQ